MMSFSTSIITLTLTAIILMINCCNECQADEPLQGMDSELGGHNQPLRMPYRFGKRAGIETTFDRLLRWEKKLSDQQNRLKKAINYLKKRNKHSEGFLEPILDITY